MRNCLKSRRFARLCLQDNAVPLKYQAFFEFAPFRQGFFPAISRVFFIASLRGPVGTRAPKREWLRAEVASPSDRASSAIEWEWPNSYHRPCRPRTFSRDRYDGIHPDRHHLHQHHPHPGDGRGAEGELRPPRCADGARPGRVHPLEPLPELRPGRPDLAQPRPLRALQRPRVDAAVLAHPPRAGAGTSTTRERFSTSRRCRWNSSSSSASSAARRRATRRTSSRPASKPRPARSGRASATRSAWRSPRSGWPPTTAAPASRRCSTTTSTPSAATAA